MRKFRTQRGVTLSSLIVYIIMMMLIVGIVATITNMFYKNINNLEDNSENIAKINIFNMYFLEEIKNEDNSIASINADGTRIAFSSGNVFQYQDKTLYYNSITICEDVQEAKFSIQEKNEHQIIEVYITIGSNMAFSKTTQYIMR